MPNCDYNCEGCNSSEGCNEKTSLLKPQNVYSNISHVIAITSGKGGVGKSMVTSLLASSLAKAGYKVGILDADITGPSIPKAFGINAKPDVLDDALIPVLTKNNIKIMSVNLLLDNETDPVIWRGPVISGIVEQFWTDVIWGDLDYLLIDMPPGTGDVALTIYQALPVERIIVVTSPQELVEMIVEKSIKMADTLNIKVLSIVENMAYFVCDNCHKKHYIFGNGNLDELAQKYDIKNIEYVPLDVDIAKYADSGKIEEYRGFDFKKTVEELSKLS